MRAGLAGGGLEALGFGLVSKYGAMTSETAKREVATMIEVYSR